MPGPKKKERRKDKKRKMKKRKNQKNNMIWRQSELMRDAVSLVQMNVRTGMANAQKPTPCFSLAGKGGAEQLEDPSYFSERT